MERASIRFDVGRRHFKAHAGSPVTKFEGDSSWPTNIQIDVPTFLPTKSG
jgi:hypothetical protein